MDDMEVLFWFEQFGRPELTETTLRVEMERLQRDFLLAYQAKLKAARELENIYKRES